MSSLAKFRKEAERMQKQMEEIQSSLAARTVEATAGGGAVKVVARCDGSLVSIKIDPAAASAGDVSMLEDMILSGVNQALELARTTSSAEMGRLTQGLSIPGLM